MTTELQPKTGQAKSVLDVFEKYQRERVHFVQTVASLAQRAQNIEVLQQAGVMQLLRPLLLDKVPSIQQSAAIALGRLANYSDDLAEAVVEEEILPQLVYSLSEQNRFYKKAAAFVLRAVAKHSPPLAQAVVNSGALDALVLCLEEFDPGVKESAAWALGYIASHNAELASTVVDAGAVGLLVICVQEPELTLKRIAASALGDIAKHTPELAQSVVDAGAVAYLSSLVTSNDSKLTRQVCSALAQVAKHSVDLAEVVVEAEVFPKILMLLKHDKVTRKHAATCVREVAKHTPEMAQLIVSHGGVGALIDYVNESEGNSRLPGIMALGYIAAFSETLALSVIVSKGLQPLYESLMEQEDHVKSASAWSLGQIGRHSPDHAKAVAEIGTLPKLVDTFVDDRSSDDLKNKCKRALKAVVEKLTHIASLDTLVRMPTIPEQIIKVVLAQMAKVLPNSAEARHMFVKSGAFSKVQHLDLSSDAQLRDSVDIINSCYPDEIVKFYSPGYQSSLLEKLESNATQQVA